MERGILLDLPDPLDSQDGSGARRDTCFGEGRPELWKEIQYCKEVFTGMLSPTRPRLLTKPPKSKSISRTFHVTLDNETRISVVLRAPSP